MPSSADNYVFIVDAYNPYARNENVIFRFIYHDQWWCVRKVVLDWGVPHNTALDLDDDFTHFHLYNTEEEAMAFVRELRKGEGLNVWLLWAK